ncbi:MAG TPA: response regulator [Terracidiphilus sp.]|nr:response regulator [Terracidiphilus sp.]
MRAWSRSGALLQSGVPAVGKTMPAPGGIALQAQGGIVPEEKILFVDDEPAILDGYQRLLRQMFHVGTALGGEKALSLIQTNGPFAVVVSDMRMPGMNGAEFLAQVREKAPHTVRMLLTGHADLNVAIEAVNQGKIFQFLSKPCEKDVLVGAIRSALEQYRVDARDRELVRKAELISRSRSDWDSDEIYQPESFAGRSSLPGPSQARAFLAPLLGADAQGFAILFKLTLLSTIESRYGEEAAVGYLKGAADFLTRSLRPEDRLFEWSRDILMAYVRRQISPAAARMEISRLTGETQQHIIEANGKRIMMALSMTFDLLPVAGYAAFDDLLGAFDAKLAAKI